MQVSRTCIASTANVGFVPLGNRHRRLENELKDLAKVCA
jgi:hypothetical protein